jgi:hypothetical protein
VDVGIGTLIAEHSATSSGERKEWVVRCSFGALVAVYFVPVAQVGIFLGEFCPIGMGGGSSAVWVDSMQIAIAKNPSMGVAEVVAFASREEHATAIGLRFAICDAMLRDVLSNACRRSARQLMCYDGLNDFVDRELRAVGVVLVKEGGSDPDSIGYGQTEVIAGVLVFGVQLF